MKNTPEKKKRIWMIIWIVIFLSFIFLDLTFKLFFYDKEIIRVFVIGRQTFKISVLENGVFIGVKCLKILAISLNPVFSLKHNAKDFFLNAALALTLLADTFFAFNPASAAAVLIFCFAQFSHSIRFSYNKKFCIARAVIMLLFLLAGFVSQISNIYAFAFVYMLLIVGNIHLSFRNFEKEKISGNKPRTTLALMAFSGFILFFLCDVFITLSFYTSTGLLPESFNRYFSFIAWFFYYPSQILIVNSAFSSSSESLSSLTRE